MYTVTIVIYVIENGRPCAENAYKIEDVIYSNQLFLKKNQASLRLELAMRCI